MDLHSSGAETRDPAKGDVRRQYLGLRHGKAGADPALQQGHQPPGLLFLSAIPHQELHVPRIGGRAIKYLKRRNTSVSAPNIFNPWERLGWTPSIDPLTTHEGPFSPPEKAHTHLKSISNALKPLGSVVLSGENWARGWKPPWSTSLGGFPCWADCYLPSFPMCCSSHMVPLDLTFHTGHVGTCSHTLRELETVPRERTGTCP